MKIFPSLVMIASPENNYPTFTDQSVTKFWDTDVYDKTNPSASTSIGLAEYSNANFFSGWTIMKTLDSFHSYPYPAWSSIQEYEEVIDSSSGKTKTYLRKTGDGETIEHLAAANSMYDILPSPLKNLGLGLDDKCHDDYARKILPRAIGYSSGLLDYFFRGSLEVTAPDEYVYSITDGSQTPYTYTDILGITSHQAQFTKIKAKIRNVTLNDTMQSGLLQAIARYRRIDNYQSDLSNYPPIPVMRESKYAYSISQPITISSLSSINPTGFTFDFTNSPIPAGITDLYLQVIFKGTLGNEKDTAVAVGMKDLMEPTHHVFWNLTDMFALDGHLYTAAQIRDNPDLLSRAGDSYIDPYPLTLSIGYMNTSPPVHTVLSAARVNGLPDGRFVRLVLLTDSQLSNNYGRLMYADDIDSIIWKSDFGFEGVLNEEVAGIWQTPTPAISLRNIKQHLYIGILRCRPKFVDPVTGEEYCPYPDEEATPTDTTPYPVTIEFQ